MHWDFFLHPNIGTLNSPLGTTILLDNNLSAVFCFLCCVCICVFAECSLHLRVWLITPILRGVGGDICSCTGVKARCVRVCVCCMCSTRTCSITMLEVANIVCTVSVSPRSACECVYMCMACNSFVCTYVWVCVMNRRFRCSARDTLLSAAGASWHRQGTRCQSSAGTCSVDQWHFFFFELKTGSGCPGINSLRGWLNAPPYIIRYKYVNPSTETQNRF